MNLSTKSEGNIVSSIFDYVKKKILNNEIDLMDQITHHQLPDKLTYVEGSELEYMGVSMYKSGKDLWAVSYNEEQYYMVLKVMEAYND